MSNKNLCCRIFKEQIDLIQQLPENERAEVLYAAITSSLNQIENQIENQNENAYVSDSVSVSVSVLSRTVLNLLQKNIVWKEFSNNYGGRRPGAGKKKQPEPEIKNPQEIIKKTAQTLQRSNRCIQITADLVFPPDQFFDAYRQQLPDATARAEQWLRKSNLVGKTITVHKIGEIIRKFEKNKNQKNT